MNKVALIGAGRWGKNILRNLYQLGALEIVCDADEKNIQFVKETYPEVKTTSDWKELLDNSAIKGVFIATPAATHFDLGKAFLEAGKDIFIEKPIVLNMADLEVLAEIAKAKNLIVMEGHLLLYHSAVQRLKKAINDGIIGKVNHLYFKRTALGSIRFESSALWDFGPHDFSIMLDLVDEMPNKVYTSGLKVFDKSGGEEIVLSSFDFNDMFIYVHESWLDPFKDRKIIAVGDNGMLVMDELAEDGKIKKYNKKIEINKDAKFEHEIFKYIDDGFEVLDYEDNEPLKVECSHFIDSIGNRTQPKSNIDNSRKVLKLLLEADSSLRSREPKTIK